MTEVYTGYKPYQEKAGKKYDPLAKQVSSSFLESLTDESGNNLYYLKEDVLSQEEQYKKYDYIIYSKTDDSPIKVETECKAVWRKEGSWQYYPDGVDVPVRKRYSTADLFVMINKSGNTLCLCRMDTVKKSKVVVKSTKISYTNTRTKEEMFFRVPLNEMLFFTRTASGWQEFKHVQVYMRLDHVAYRVADRKKTAQFFIDFFGYKIQDEFTINFPDGSTAKCIALEPPEKKEDFDWEVSTIDAGANGATVFTSEEGVAVVPMTDTLFHLAPEIFVSDGTPDSVVGKWVANRDGIGGIHHLAYQVEDVRAAMEEMAKTGVEFTSEDVLTCPDDELHQIFTKPHPLTGTIYEFIKRGEHGFCKDNVKDLMESTKDLK